MALRWQLFFDPQVNLKGLAKATAQRLQETRSRRLHQYFYGLRAEFSGCKHIGLSLDFSRVAKRKVGVGAISHPITNILGWAPPQAPRETKKYVFQMDCYFLYFQCWVLRSLARAVFLSQNRPHRRRTLKNNKETAGRDK
jgi:hypothetical protein